MYYFDVVPFLSLPESKSVLTYWSKENFQAGQVVLVKIKNRSFSAVVFRKTKSKPQREILPIEKVITSYPVILPFQFKLLKWLSDFYFASLSKTLKVCLPLKSFSQNVPHQIPSVRNSVPQKPSLVLGPNLHRLTTYGQLVKKTLKTEGQALLVFPDLESVEKASNFFAPIFGGKLLTYSDGLKKTLRSQVWQKILQGQPNVILSTRSGFFLPCSRLSLLIVDSPVSLGQTETQTPTYQSLEIALELQKLTACNLVVGETAISLKSLWLLQRKKIKILKESKEKPAKFKISLNPSGFFSFGTEEKMKEIIEKGGRVLVFVNQKRGGIICQDCQQILVCSECSRSLKFSEGNELVCSFCGFKPTFQNCPYCQSLRLKEFGISISKISQELKKVFPEFQIPAITAEKGEQKIDNSPIVICTKKILTSSLKDFRLGVVLGIDQMLSIPHFQAQEQTYLTISELSFFLPEIIIETKNINHPLLLAFFKNKTRSWLEKELELRKNYHFPPWTRWLKITQKGRADKIDEVQKKIASFLKQTEFFREIGAAQGKTFASLSFSISLEKNEALSSLFKEASSALRIEVDSLKNL